jgi:hypothetical protein
VYLRKSRYNIISTIITIIDKMGDIKNTCSIAMAAAKSTIIADGVNALNKDKAKTIGIDLNLTSYPISLFIA